MDRGITAGPGRRRAASLVAGLRLAAYGCGAAGAGGVFLGRRMGSGPGERWCSGLGWGLLLAMFILFCVSHAVWIWLRHFAPRSAPRPGAGGQEP